MKLAAVADVHIGNHRKHGGDSEVGLNRRCREVISALNAAADLACENEVDAFLVCGDLFDSARPLPQMIAAAQRVLDKVPAIVLKGNHDGSSTDAGDHALAPLSPIATVVDEPQLIEVGGAALIAVPFMPGAASEWFEDTVSTLAKDVPSSTLKLLAFHLGVEDNHTPSYLRGAPDSVKLKLVEKVMLDRSIRYAFCGNWHEHRHWYVINGKCGIVQCGTLAPTGWDNGGVLGYGQLVLFDSNKNPQIKTISIPGPRFLTVQGARAADTIVKSARDEGNSVYVKWRTDMRGVVAAQEELREWQDAGLISGWETTVEDEEAEEAARTAAKVARKAETLGEALAKFVAEMPLEEGIDRGEVLSRATRYLGGV